MAPLRNVIVSAIYISDLNEGFVPSNKSKQNTMTATMKFVAEHPAPEFDVHWWAMTDEIITYFRMLPGTPQYEKLKKETDFSLYQKCIEISKQETIDQPLEFNFAVMMPVLYTKLNPKEPIRLNPLKTEAKLYEPGKFLGTLGEPERFFMKLVQVEVEDKAAGGNLFVLKDRSNNTALFYDRADRWDECIQLGHVFHFHAIPQKHTYVGENKDQVTVFRNVEFIESAGLGAVVPPDTDDKTGRFTKKKK